MPGNARHSIRCKNQTKASAYTEGYYGHHALFCLTKMHLYRAVPNPSLFPPGYNILKLFYPKLNPCIAIRPGWNVLSHWEFPANETLGRRHRSF